MKKLSLIALVAAVLAFMIGCGGGGGSSSSGDITITFTNSSEYMFNEIYISPTAADEWGSELLGDTSVLKANGSIDVTIIEYDYDNYDIRIVDEDRDEYLFTRVPLSDGFTVYIYFGEQGLVATVLDEEGDEITTVSGSMNGGGNLENQGPQADDEAVITGTGYDTDGDFSFTIYNESDYDIYSIFMGLLNAPADLDMDILDSILSAGDSYTVSETMPESLWGETEWTLYIVDVDGDTSVSYDTFNPFLLEYVDITWDTDTYGYLTNFVY